MSSCFDFNRDDIAAIINEHVDLHTFGRLEIIKFRVTDLNLLIHIIFDDATFVNVVGVGQQIPLSQAAQIRKQSHVGKIDFE